MRQVKCSISELLAVISNGINRDSHLFIKFYKILKNNK